MLFALPNDVLEAIVKALLHIDLRFLNKVRQSGKVVGSLAQSCKAARGFFRRMSTKTEVGGRELWNEARLRAIATVLVPSSDLKMLFAYTAQRERFHRSRRQIRLLKHAFESAATQGVRMKHTRFGSLRDLNQERNVSASTLGPHQGSFPDTHCVNIGSVVMVDDWVFTIRNLPELDPPGEVYLPELHPQGEGNLPALAPQVEGVLGGGTRIYGVLAAYKPNAVAPAGRGANADAVASVGAEFYGVEDEWRPMELAITSRRLVVFCISSESDTAILDEATCLVDFFEWSAEGLARTARVTLACDPDMWLGWVDLFGNSTGTYEVARPILWVGPGEKVFLSTCDRIDPQGVATGFQMVSIEEKGGPPVRQDFVDVVPHFVCESNGHLVVFAQDGIHIFDPHNLAFEATHLSVEAMDHTQRTWKAQLDLCQDSNGIAHCEVSPNGEYYLLTEGSKDELAFSDTRCFRRTWQGNDSTAAYSFELLWRRREQLENMCFLPDSQSVFFHVTYETGAKRICILDLVRDRHLMELLDMDDAPKLTPTLVSFFENSVVVLPYYATRLVLVQDSREYKRVAEPPRRMRALL